MIDRHAVHALLEAGQSSEDIAAQLGVARRTIQRIAKEPPVEEGNDAAARRRRGVGRPAVEERVRVRLRDLVRADPGGEPLEHLRQLREQGTGLGESTFYRLYRMEKEALPGELMVRFEGVAGEFAQFDFGQADVRLLDGSTRRIHFAAYRLKYSRWVWVVPVPDERVESLVRALLLCFEHSGGVPLCVVFDNPKTVVTGRDEHGRPIWNQTLAQVAIDYGFVIELCAPRSPEQKGSVENLVGWVKRSFFRARHFADVEHDLPRQLLEWLTVANEGPELVSAGRCAIIAGAPGRGKTHLAVAIAYRAIQNGFEACFTTADELIGDLSAAAQRGELEEALDVYLHPHVLVIDELGYQSHAADAANVLFRVVSMRHLRYRPIIVTTNKPLAALGQVLHDGDLRRPFATGCLNAARTTSCAAARTEPVT